MAVAAPVIGLVAVVVAAALAFAAVYLLAPPHLHQTLVVVTTIVATGTVVTAAVILLPVHRRRATSEFVLTADRAYAATGRWRRRVHATTYEKITDTTVEEGIWGRMAGYGTVTLRTAGGSLPFKDIPAPMRFRHEIDRARKAFIGRVLRHAPPTKHPLAQARARPDAPGDVPQEVETWSGRPTMVGLVSGMVPLVVLGLLLGPLLVDVVQALPRSLGPAVPVTSVLAVLAIVGVSALRIRNTRFHVHAEGVSTKRGVFTTQHAQANFSKITDVSLNQGILGRIFGYGTLVLNTAGSNEAPVHFTNIRDAERVQGIIDRARRRV